MKLRLKVLAAALFALSLLAPSAGKCARLLSVPPSCCAGDCPMDKEEGPAQAACCRDSVPAESRVAAPLPQAQAALPAAAPRLATGAEAATFLAAPSCAPRSHAPPSPTGLSPPALA